ncbi:MAG: hypothetical protein Harvfovirus1_15 [Harvfovirus sp.]|uniref:Sel1 repeat family protein n=1 Tax=Harvfovirus sp. TaxID=2487768 RepID=A0A3G4ZZU4_9VIRU|nr:MAG: hypothetical protein Harvfovirus1_15 [Harvfovirus sp.]
MDQIIKHFITGDADDTIAKISEHFSVEEKISLFKGMEFYAKEGDYMAQFWLAEMYEEGIGVDRDIAKSFYWNKLSAEQSNSHYDQNYIARCYEKGTGTDVDKEKALEWYQKAVKNGSTEALYNLARIHQNNDDIDEAIYCFIKIYHQLDKKKEKRQCKEALLELIERCDIDMFEEWMKMHKRILVLEQENENINHIIKELTAKKSIGII